MGGSNLRLLNYLLPMMRSRFVTHRPFFLAHAITYGCNSKCKTCTFWQTAHNMREDMSTEEVYDLLDEAYDYGMRCYYLFGGEPLVRRDIEEVVRYAKKKGFMTVINTNGSLIEKKDALWEDMDFAFISLDYFDGFHDFIRGRSGSFKEVVNGIKRLKELGKTKVTIVSTISTLNFGAIEEMAKFAQELGVGISYNSVEIKDQFYSAFENTIPSNLGGIKTVSPVNEYGLSDEKLHVFYETILRLKREGYPLMETEVALKDYAEGKPWTCHFPKIFVYVSPNKKIYDCTCHYTYDLRNGGSFRDYFSSSLYKEHVKDAEGCNLCVRTCVRMYSYTYILKPSNFVSLYKDIGLLMNQRPRRL